MNIKVAAFTVSEKSINMWILFKTLHAFLSSADFFFFFSFFFFKFFKEYHKSNNQFESR